MTKWDLSLHTSELGSYVLQHVDQAMAEGWIRPYYQLVVRSATSELCAEEALARWIDPTHGMLMPEQFMPVLAAADKLHEIDRHMLDCIVQDLKRKRELDLPFVPVSVNLSHHDLAWFNIAEVIAEKLDAVNLPHYLINIEFTEQIAPESPEIVKQQIRLLHEGGFGVWLDNFGSGYSALNLLQEFDFDVIKLDAGFVSTVTTNERTREVVSGIVKIGARLGVATLAEGVETKEQALLLENVGCNMMQGHYFSKSHPVEEVIARFQRGWVRTCESLVENRYWNTIGSLSLTDPTTNIDGLGYNGKPALEYPASVIERRNGEWRVLRANKTYERFIGNAGLLPTLYSPMRANTIEGLVDEDLVAAADRASVSGVWEMIQGRKELSSELSFFLRKAAETQDAEAFLVSAQPTTLGSSLGIYGDVPIAYALFQVELDETGTQVTDAVFIFANSIYSEIVGVDQDKFAGMSLKDLSMDKGESWFPFFYQSLVLHKNVHHVMYGTEIGHWISFNMAPSPISKCCSFAFSVVDDERRERDRLEWMGSHDALTGLLNRHGIDMMTAKQVEENPNEPFVVALLDIDDFKIINDVHGHAVGDAALRYLAESVRKWFPKSSIVGRNGGDEVFIMLVGDAVDQADDLFERFTETHRSFEHEGLSYPMTVSIGYAACPTEAKDFPAAQARADDALYAVKLGGKSGCMRYSNKMKTQYRSQLGFTPRDIAEFVPGGIMVHRAGGDGDILFVNDELIEMFECKDMAEFMELVGGSFRGVVHPDDAVRVYEELVGQMTLDDVGEKGYCRYRIRTKNGTPRYVESNGRLVEVDGIGKVFYLLMLER